MKNKLLPAAVFGMLLFFLSCEKSIIPNDDSDTENEQLPLKSLTPEELASLISSIEISDSVKFADSIEANFSIKIEEQIKSVKKTLNN